MNPPNSPEAKWGEGWLRFTPVETEAPRRLVICSESQNLSQVLTRSVSVQILQPMVFFQMFSFFIYF